MTPSTSPSCSKLSLTTFVLPNLHCDSCVYQIEQALHALHPEPISISHSIIAHTITVSHPPGLTVPILTQALDDAGFDVYDEKGFSHRVSGALDQAVQKWRYGSKDLDVRKRKRHIENCEQCQIKFQEDNQSEEKRKSTSTTHEQSLRWSNETKGDITGSGETLQYIKEKPGEHGNMEELPQPVQVQDQRTSLQYEAVVAIEGMTCASCTASVSESLKDEPWVHNINVNLLTNSASVTFERESNTDKIIEAIADIGFETALQKVIPLHPSRTERSRDDQWEAIYTVSGMTCSSCVASITEQLKQHPWIRNVDVNLVSNTARVAFEGRNHAEEIVDLINDTGFEAILDSWTKAGQVTDRDITRTVGIRVNGMYCEHCPGKVTSAVRDLQFVNLEEDFSQSNPILQLSFLPNPPRHTIRTILDAIKKKDAAFEPFVHHPPSIEERSRRMHRRQQKAIGLRVLLSLASAIPTFIIGIVYMSLLSENNTGRHYFMEEIAGVPRGNWAMFILATPVYLFTADIFHRRTLKELRSLWRSNSPVPIVRRFYRFGSMNMLVSLGTSIAFWGSLGQMIATSTDEWRTASGSENKTYFDSVVFLTLFLLLGRLIEAYSKAKTGDAVDALSQMRPANAMLIEQGNHESISQTSSETRQVSRDLIDVGDTVRVLPGSSPPVDGVIVQGHSQFDESSLTGESKLVAKQEGDEVFSGTINKVAAVNIRVTGVVGESMLDKVVAVIREGQSKRAPMERTADMLTSYFVPVITATAILVWIVWMILGLSGTLPQDYLDVDIGGWPYWSLQFAIAVFVVACPCGLGLAAPTALFVGSGIAAKHGILVKGGGEAFQEASNIDLVAFDKTGTLTTGGAPRITGSSLESDGEDIIYALISKLEQDSNHPVAKALVDHCKSDVVEKIKTISTSEISGKGMRGVFDTVALTTVPTKIEVLVGNEALLTDNSVSITPAQASRLQIWKRLGSSVALAATRRTVATSHTTNSEPFTLKAMFAASDSLRPEATHVIKTLQRANKSVWMITGDNETTARAVASQVGILADHVIAGVLPTEKAEKIKYLQRSQPKQSSLFSSNKGKRATVAMIGDGINDAPALATADVGIALATGADVAVQTAPFVILNPSSSEKLNLNTVLTLVRLSRTVFRRVRFNFGWALVYNLCLVPLAAGVIYPARSSGGGHVRLDPTWAALAMALSSLSVVVSSLALRLKVPIVGFRSDEGREKPGVGKGVGKGGGDVEVRETDLEKGLDLDLTG